MPRRQIIGVVTSAKAAKTRRVTVDRLVRHDKYNKLIRRRTVCYAHDEDDASREGDTVEIEESRPYSALKRWRLVRIVKQQAAELAQADKILEQNADQVEAEGTEAGNG